MSLSADIPAVVEKFSACIQMEEAVPYFQRGICLSGTRAGTASGADTENSRETAKQIMDRLGITKENIDRSMSFQRGDR